MWAYLVVAEVLHKMSSGDHFTNASPHKKTFKLKANHFHFYYMLAK